MDRLTVKNGKKTFLTQQPLKSECTKCLSLKRGCEETKTRECHYLKMIDKLAAYEDTGLTPAEVAELAQAKADGLLLVLPCKLGRIVYMIDNGKIQRCIVEKPISHDGIIAIGVGVDKGYGVYKENIGKTVFLTKAEAQAQAALDRMEGQE